MVLAYSAAALAVFCYAVLAIISKKVLLGGVPEFAFMAITMFALCLASLGTSYFLEDRSFIKVMNLKTVGMMLLFASVNFIGFFLLIWCIQRIPVVHYQLLGLFTPIIGGVMAYVFLNETFHWQYLVGIPLMGLGLFIALYRPI